MRLKSVIIHKFRNFEKVRLDFEKTDFPDIFSIASINGGGKSTLLQFIFVMLNCLSNEEKYKYIKNLLGTSKISNKIVDFIIEDEGKEYYLNFFVSKLSSKEFNYNHYIDLNEIDKEIKKLNDYKTNFTKIIRLQNIINDQIE